MRNRDWKNLGLLVDLVSPNCLFLIVFSHVFIINLSPDDCPVKEKRLAFSFL